jgi:hypothetical protein
MLFRMTVPEVGLVGKEPAGPVVGFIMKVPPPTIVPVGGSGSKVPMYCGGLPPTGDLPSGRRSGINTPGSGVEMGSGLTKYRIVIPGMTAATVPEIFCEEEDCMMIVPLDPIITWNDDDVEVGMNSPAPPGS